jgi:hypothetical protein
VNDEGILLATWWGVIVAALVGISGLIVGIVGLVQAKSARSAAADANVIAKDANAVSKQANRLASDANAISQRANGFAEEANDLVRAGHDRTTEQHDVRWESRWETAGVRILKNAGLDTAYSVRVQVTVDDEVVTAHVDECAPGDIVRLDMPISAEALERENARDKAARKTRSGNGWVAIGSPIKRDTHYFHERVFWRTELGTPREHDEQWNDGRLTPPVKLKNS